MEKKIWLINKSSEKIDICIIELRKWFCFKPLTPIAFESCIALKYVSKYNDLQICDNPQQFYNKNKPLKQLIIRDAGIGDLLLLEPVLRTMHEEGNVIIDVLTRYPDTYDNHPSLNKVHLQDSKCNTNSVNMKDYDTYEDLRSYSENSPNRAKQHRTDIYNDRFNYKIDDKEPRIYFNKDEKSTLKKKKGFKYVGVQLDASHSYRRFYKNKELIDELLKQGYKVVVLGSYEQTELKKHKNIIDLQGKTTIREAFNIIRNLDYMIAVDSGLMHVALALHIPTVSIFSIITPDFRMRYYTGQYKIITKNGLDCIGCGDFHMKDCKHDNSVDEKFIPPCMNLDIEMICNELKNFKTSKKRVFNNVVKNVNINLLKTKKLTMPIIVQDEEHNLPKFIENVIKHPSIGRVIAIDGGSKDNTVKLLKSAGVDVYEHPYIKTYHEMQAMQRNISCSYCKDGDKIIIMDIDECFSKELSEYLPFLAESNIDYGIISRRTFNYYKDIADPSKAIKDYPDFQPRFYTWNRKYKFVGGAHHITLNCPEPIKIQKDIIHFEKENGKRDIIEKQWAGMMSGVKQYV